MKTDSALVTKVFDEVNNDPEWVKLKAERDQKIKEIEDEYHREYVRIRNKYWKKYGIIKRIGPVR